MEKSDCDEFTQDIKPRLALTLTTAQQTDYTQVWNCKRYFWQIMRRAFPKLQFWGVVEVNQKHSLVHFHYLLAGYDFIHFEFIRFAWQKAQAWAGYDVLAWDVRIEKIQKNVEAYFTKYLTKAAGGIKDEIPTKADWQGRHVRYSKKFFGVPVAAMALAATFKAMLARDEEIDRKVYLARKPLAMLSGWLEDKDHEAKLIYDIVNRTWNPQADKYDAKPLDNSPTFEFTYCVDVTLPKEGTLLQAVPSILAHIKQLAEKLDNK